MSKVYDVLREYPEAVVSISYRKMDPLFPEFISIELRVRQDRAQYSRMETVSLSTLDNHAEDIETVLVRQMMLDIKKKEQEQASLAEQFTINHGPLPHVAKGGIVGWEEKE